MQVDKLLKMLARGKLVQGLRTIARGRSKPVGQQSRALHLLRQECIHTIR
jgi:hypothetical protein